MKIYSCNASSHIRELGYDTAHEILRISFYNGDIYEYIGVSVHTFEGLYHAESVGTYFWKYIRGRYSYRKI